MIGWKLRASLTGNNIVYFIAKCNIKTMKWQLTLGKNAIISFLHPEMKSNCIIIITINICSCSYFSIPLIMNISGCHTFQFESTIKNHWSLWLFSIKVSSQLWYYFTVSRTEWLFGIEHQKSVLSTVAYLFNNLYFAFIQEFNDILWFRPFTEP